MDQMANRFPYFPREILPTKLAAPAVPFQASITLMNMLIGSLADENCVVHVVHVVH